MKGNLDNAVVYKIFCKDNAIEDFYIGSTSNLIGRLALHRNTKKREVPLYKCIDGNGGWENWDYEILEQCKVNSFKEMLFREKFYFDKLSPTLNCYTPINTMEEQKIKRKPRDIKYYYKNREKILEKLSSRKITCECGSVFTSNHLARHLKTKKHLDYLESKNHH